MKRLAIICLLEIFAGCEKDPTPIVTGPFGAAKEMSVNAGSDMQIELPLSTPVRLNSGESANFSKLEWRKISGPECMPFDSIMYNDPDLLFWNPGNYSFELTVRNRSRSLKDTVNILAKASSGCSETPEAYVMGKPELTDLDIQVPASVFITAGEKFAGNYFFNVPPSTYYNIALYDIPTKKVSALTLKTDAYQMTVANTSDAFYFAGGNKLDSNSYTSKTNKVSIYDKKADLWSDGVLSEARSNSTGIGVGDLVFFAGGQIINGTSSTVDIYNQRTKKWTAALLSEARTDILALSDGHKVFFAGGTQNGVQSNKLDIYDIATGEWSVEQFTDPYYHLKGFFADGRIYFVGNIISDTKTTSVVEIRDLNGHHLGQSCLPAGVSAISQQSPLLSDQFALVPGIALTPYSPIINLFDKQSGKWKLLIPDKALFSGLPNSNAMLTYNNKLYGLVVSEYWDEYLPSLFSVDLK